VIESGECMLFIMLAFFIGIAICGLAVNMTTKYNGKDYG